MDTKSPDPNRVLKFQRFLIAMSEIERLIHFPDSKNVDRLENNSEHSYSLAMTAWYIADYYPKFNKNKLIRYALVHDLVEVYSGDELAIGRSKEAEKAKREREEQALVKLAQDWHDAPSIIEAIKQYEGRTDLESQFIYALDKLMPLFLNILGEGKTWKAYDFKLEAVLKAKDSKIAISPEVNELWQYFRDYIQQKPDFFNTPK